MSITCLFLESVGVRPAGRASATTTASSRVQDGEQRVGWVQRNNFFKIRGGGLQAPGGRAQRGFAATVVAKRAITMRGDFEAEGARAEMGDFTEKFDGRF